MGEDRPLVTVVMPVFDGMRWLGATAASVAAQRGVRLQRMAIDDGSGDGSGEFLRRAGWTVLETARTGPNVARRVALEQAQGDLVAMLDQDDLWHPDHLALANAALRDRPTAPAAVGPRLTFGDTVPPPRLGGARRGPGSFDPWAAYPINLIDAPSMVVIRREALTAAGGWPADRPLGADSLAWWRLSAAAPFAVLASRTVGVRRSPESLSAVRRERPLEYLRHLTRAAHDALDARPEAERPRLDATGSAILAALGGLAAATLDVRSVAAEAAALERSLAGSAAPLVVAAVGFLGWLVGPALRSPRYDGRDPVELLLETWPAAAPRTRAEARRALGAIVGSPRAFRSALRGPLRPGRLALAAAACAHAFAGRMGRVSDPLSLRFPPPIP
jgi:hypothetical protein